MKYVLDANVALRFVLNEMHSDKARRLRDEFRAGHHELLAPDFFPVEVAHVLTKTERRRAIPQGQSNVLLEDILADCPILYDPFPYLSMATEMSSQTRGSVYDLIYYLLAEDHGCQLITADRKLVNTFPGSRSIVELSQL